MTGLITITGLVAALMSGLLGMAPAAVQASAGTSVPAWTKQAPAAHPGARGNAAMAYDAATGTVVLFGGRSASGRDFGDTWTWDGSTWTKQAPATRPPAMLRASMAYDAATGTVVLFGGVTPISGSTRTRLLADTWTWDGSTWTKQAPATRPHARASATMAYDAASGTVVLFGGDGKANFVNDVLADTWTWDGSTWTKQAPAVHPVARDNAAMAYDAASGTVVLFGGNHPDRLLGDTWTWDGSTWTKQASPTRPHAREEAAMAYDAASGTVVLFGGFDLKVTKLLHALSDTWTWG